MKPIACSVLPRSSWVAVALFMVIAVGGASAEPQFFYVASGGSDTATGLAAQRLGEDGPFATLARAQLEARALHARDAWPEEGVVILLAPGRYQLDRSLNFDHQDGGTNAGPLVFRAAKPGSAILSGSVALGTPTPAGEDALLAGLDSEARSHVVKFDLAARVPDELPGFVGGGSGFLGRRDYAVQIYENGERLPLARWPNEGFARSGDPIGASVVPSHGIRTFTEGRFTFVDDRLKRWANEPDLWAHGRWFFHWADQSFRVAEVDVQTHQIRLADPHMNAYGFRADRDFYVFNALSELDRPGEWAIDRRHKTVFVWPVNPDNVTRLEIALVDSLVKGNGAKHLRFEGLTFEATRGDAIRIDDGEDVAIVGCTIRRTGGYAVQLLGGSNNRVMHSDLYDLGEGGVVLDGGSRAELVPGGHMVENCHIHHLGKTVETYRPGVDLRGVGNTARHNLIHDSPHCGLMFEGNEHLLEYNIIHDVCLHTSDAGGIYACTRDWSMRGNVVRFNLVHRLGTPLDVVGCRAIYLDDFTSGVTVRGNIVTMATVGIHIGGGRDNLVTNNMMLHCDIPIDLEPRGTDSFAGAAEDAAKGRESRVYRALLASPRDTPAWRGKYPALEKIMADDPVAAHDALDNVITDNIMADGGDMKIQSLGRIGSRLTMQRNITLPADPGLTNAGALDLRLLPDGPARQALPTFEPLRYLDMGLYDDPARPTDACKFGPNVTPLTPFGN